LPGDTTKGLLTNFWTAQCYFASKSCFSRLGILLVTRDSLRHPVTASIAAFAVTDFANIDPLNGYAMISVAIGGFMPPIFTMILLQSLGIRSKLATFLTFISWVASSVLFFMLIAKLGPLVHGQAVFEEGLKNLFTVPACGDSSAMSLCQQIMGTNPLAYLNGFYNRNRFPSIQTVHILWAWATVVFIFSLYDRWRGTILQYIGRRLAVPIGSASNIFEHKYVRPIVWIVENIFGPLMFSFTLVYQILMVVQYYEMDVVDFSRQAWTFGQIVAVAVWIPPVLEALLSAVRNFSCANSTYLKCLQPVLLERLLTPRM